MFSFERRTLFINSNISIQDSKDGDNPDAEDPKVSIKKMGRTRRASEK